jgi:hypothetical protein
MKFGCSFAHDRVPRATRGRHVRKIYKPNGPVNIACRRVELLREMQHFPQTHTRIDEDRQEADSAQRESPAFTSSSQVCHPTPGQAVESIAELLYTGSADSQEHQPGDNVTAESAIIHDLGNDSFGNDAHPTGSPPSWVDPTSDRFLASDVPTIIPQRSHDHLGRLHSYTSAVTAIGSHTSPQSPFVFESSLRSPQSSPASTIWPSQYEEKDVLQWLDVFFERLHATLPIVDKALYRDFMLRHHHADKDFAALILALCSLAIVGPVYRKERDSMVARTSLAKDMLASAATLRTSYDFGEQPNLEATTVTSFFMVRIISIVYEMSEADYTIVCRSFRHGPPESSLVAIERSSRMRASPRSA